MKKLLFVMLAVAAVSLASCSKDEEETSIYKELPKMVQIDPAKAVSKAKSLGFKHENTQSQAKYIMTKEYCGSLFTAPTLENITIESTLGMTPLLTNTVSYFNKETGNNVVSWAKEAVLGYGKSGKVMGTAVTFKWAKINNGAKITDFAEFKSSIANATTRVEAYWCADGANFPSIKLKVYTSGPNTEIDMEFSRWNTESH